MKRVIWHWSVSGYKATSSSLKAYHESFEGDGKMVVGKYPISYNASIKRSRGYAAHTRGANTMSIGLAVMCMFRAKENVTSGPYPMTEVQFEAMMKRTAEHCKKYNIKVSRKTTLSHAEAERELGRPQRGKWDFTILPFKPELQGARACGDYARDRVRFYLAGGTSRKQWGVVLKQPLPTPSVEQQRTVETVFRFGDKNWWIGKLQERLRDLGYNIKDFDSWYGRETLVAVNAFKVDNNIALDNAGTISLSSLIDAKPSIIAAHKSNTTMSDLRRDGSRTVLKGDQGQIASLGFGSVVGGTKALATLTAAGDQAGKAGEAATSINDAITPLSGLLKTLNDNVWIIAIVLAVAAVWYFHKVKQARLDDAQTGKHTG